MEYDDQGVTTKRGIGAKGHFLQVTLAYLPHAWRTFPDYSTLPPPSQRPLPPQPLVHQPPTSPLQAGSGDAAHSSEGSCTPIKVYVVVHVTSSPELMELSLEEEVKPEEEEEIKHDKKQEEHEPEEQFEEQPGEHKGDFEDED